METLVGSSELTVEFRDGRTQTVTVRQLPIKLYQQYLASMDDECAMVELLCSYPKGWADTLTPASHVAVVEEGTRINRDFFEPWVQRRLERQKLFVPDLLDRMLKMAEPGQPSPASPPASRRNAGSPSPKQPITP